MAYILELAGGMKNISSGVCMMNFNIVSWLSIFAATISRLDTIRKMIRELSP